jgi:hypothetical protein
MILSGKIKNQRAVPQLKKIKRDANKNYPNLSYIIQDIRAAPVWHYKKTTRIH